MTKAELIEKISGKTGVGKIEVSACVEAFMEEVINSLTVEKEDVFLRGFGSFIVKHRAAKTAQNITKKTTMVIPEHDIPAFKPADEFVKIVRGE